jgi:hypothetical protein
MPPITRAKFDARMALSLAGVADPGRTRDPSGCDEEPDSHQVRESEKPSHGQTNPGAAARFPQRVAWDDKRWVSGRARGVR